MNDGGSAETVHLTVSLDPTAERKLGDAHTHDRVTSPTTVLHVRRRLGFLRPDPVHAPDQRTKRWPSAIAAPQAWHSIGWAFLVTQIYLLVRIWLRLAFVSSEIVFFQGELAHAGYTARPPHVWPNSAAAEAIENLTMKA